MTVLVEEVPTLAAPVAAAAALELPVARGALSQGVVDHLTGGAGDVVDASTGIAGQPHDGDFQTALWILNVAQVQAFRGVDPDRPGSLRTRTLHWYLEQTFEDQLRRLVRPRTPDDLLAHLRALLDRSGATRDGAPGAIRRRFLASAPYLAWATDAHTLALARVETALKPGLAAIQAGEHGVGDAGTHADLYRACVDELGHDLADAVSAAPACSLALANAAWLFGRDRRLRGAAVGQVCLQALEAAEFWPADDHRWDPADLPPAARRWYDAHEVADRRHGRIVAEELVPAVERCAPALAGDVAWGAEVTAVLQDCVADACAGGPTRH